MCGQDECAEEAESIEEGYSGETVVVNLRNECDRTIEVRLLPEGSDLPPADAPHFELAAGERRQMAIDKGASFTRRGGDGRFRSTIHSDAPGALIRFSGEGCESVRADNPPAP